ncbi:uncharacterized protein LOC122965264 isoform X2 [Acropora millepora]|uniref:uncharacterized protein LOC122965264 isoform X2 n=1 Tax=Acropora millepora TaxID=45264 RepID=UPI001CF2BCE4|nr:uncharacterized protein LOC122965264 isoform X2 [Acropora millepora]
MTKFLFVVVLLVCTNLLFSQRGNAVTGTQGCGTTSKFKPINIHVHCSAQEKGCGTTSKSEAINIHVHSSAQEKGCGTTSKFKPINIHVHCSAQEKDQKGEKGTPCDCGSPSADKSSAEPQEPSCSTGWVQHGKSCYIVIDIPTAEWSAARQNCLKFGGDLAKITRDDENQFLYNLIGNQTYTTHEELFSQGSRNSMPENLKTMLFFVLLSSFLLNFQP